MDLNNLSLISKTNTQSDSNSINKNQRVQIVEESEIGKLDQNAFLNMLITQLQNQDPLNPLDNTDFAAQLAQYSSLEQLTTISEKIDTIAELILAQMMGAGSNSSNNTNKDDNNSVNDSTENNPNTSVDEDNSNDSIQNSEAQTITLTKNFTYPDNNLSSKINSLIKKNIYNTYFTN